MKINQTSWCVMLFTVFVIVLHGRLAQAYLDPGTGSYLLQILIAGLLGAGFAVKMFWKRIRAFFSRLFSRSQDSSHK